MEQVEVLDEGVSTRFSFQDYPVRSFVRSFIHLFIHSFVHSCIHLY